MSLFSSSALLFKVEFFAAPGEAPVLVCFLPYPPRPSEEVIIDGISYYVRRLQWTLSSEAKVGDQRVAVLLDQVGTAGTAQAFPFAKAGPSE